MKSPVTAIEVRWRETGTQAWHIRRFLPDAPIQIREIERAEGYDIEARALGMGELTSAWAAAAVSVPDTHRKGVLALPPNAITNQTSMWGMDTEVTYSAVSPTTGDSTATISMSAGHLVIGDRTIAYGASSASVTGPPSTSRTVFLYFDDPRLEGGTRPLGVANTPVAAANVYGRVAVTSLKVTFPPAGGSGGGGGGIGGGGGGGGPNPPPYDLIPE